MPVRPFSVTGAVNTKNAMLNNMIGSYPFTMTTNINNNTSNFILDIPRSFRECLGGYEGSILDVFRPEYEWDNLTVKMLAKRGSDEGVRISYGKNLTDFTQEENIESVYTAVLGFARINDITYLGNVYNKVTTSMPKVLIVDFSEKYSEESLPTTAKLTTDARTYATNNSIEVPNVSLTISFVSLYQTEEYKNIAPLERVRLGDTVHVYFEKLDVEASARVVKTIWNCNLNKYDSVELGNAKANLKQIIDSSISGVKEDIINSLDLDTAYLENELNDMATLIINGLGLHRTLVPVATGGYRMYLHNKPTLAESDTQYMIGASGFVVSTDYGATWNAGFDSQGNAVVNSLSTIVLKALEIYGSYLCFGDYPNGKYIEASTYSTSNVQQGVSFDGTGTIRMRPKDQFLVENIYNYGTTTRYYNRIEMNKSDGDANSILIANYDNTYNTNLQSNYLYMSAHASSSNTYNRLLLINFATHTQARVEANSVRMYAYTNRNLNLYQNNKVDTSQYANRIVLEHDDRNATATERFISTNILNFAYAADRTSNEILLKSTSIEHYVAVSNKFLVSAYDCNLLELVTHHNSESTDPDENLNRISLTNKRFNSNVVANYFEMKATEKSIANNRANFVTLRNYYYDYSGTNRYANILQLSSSTLTGNTLHLLNYRYNGSDTSNAFYLYSTSAASFVDIQNRIYNSTSLANRLYMRSDSTAKTFEIGNYNGSSLINSIVLKSESSGNSITITNSGANPNSIALKDDGSIKITASDLIELTSSNDTLIQGGAVRLASRSAQDVTIFADDDLWLSWTNKFFLRTGGTTYQVGVTTMSGYYVLTVTPQ